MSARETVLGESTEDTARLHACAPKLFVLDTNVILHDARCLRSFAENDVALPIVVLEELDNFKRGERDINLQAREFVRQLDALTHDAGSADVLSAAGVPLGDGLGTVRVVLAGPVHPRLAAAGFGDTADHRILNAALHLAEQEPGRTVALVTKDVNLRLKAKALDLIAQDYTSDKVAVEGLYAGWRKVEHLAGTQLAGFFVDDGLVDPEVLALETAPRENERFVLRNGTSSVLASFADESFRRLEAREAYGIRPRNVEQLFALDVLLDDAIPLVTLAGKAGTGKTLLALAAALERRSRYRQIMLARPLVSLSNRDIGYLPGDVEQKIAPYMQPLFDNLAVIREEVGHESKAGARIARMQTEKKLVVEPLAYIRGRSLQRVFLIVDEAQNLTPHEVKTIITRAGEGTKIVFTGDVHQIDQPYLDARSNGLSYLIHRMVGQRLFAHVSLTRGERSALADVASQLL